MPPTINPSIIAAIPVCGDLLKVAGAIMKMNAPIIIRKNPPLFLGLLCSLCAKTVSLLGITV